MITTIVWKILLIIILVIVVLLHFSLTVYIKGGTGGEFVIKAKYLGITLYPRGKKSKKAKKKKPKKDELDDDLDDFDDDIPSETPKDEVTDISEDKSEDSTEDGAAGISEDKPAVTLDEPAENEPEEEVSEKAAQDKSDKKDKKKKPDKKKQKKKAENESKKEDKPRDGEKKEGKLDELKRKWEFIKPYIPPVWKYTKKLLKAVRIEDIKINIDTGKEDAAESATFYGKLQAALFNTLNLLAMIFTVKVKKANINCLFNVKKLDAEGEATIRVRPSTVIAIAVCLLWCCGRIFVPYWLKKRRERKKAEKQAKKRAELSETTEPA